MAKKKLKIQINQSFRWTPRHSEAMKGALPAKSFGQWENPNNPKIPEMGQPVKLLVEVINKSELTY